MERLCQSREYHNAESNMNESSESEDRHAAAGFQAVRKHAEKRIERHEFLIHRDPDGLENSPDGEFCISRARGISNGFGEIERGLE